MPYSSLTELSPCLKPDENITAFTNENLPWFEKLALELDVPLKFLLIQALLHLPSFSKSALTGQNADTTKQTLRRVLEHVCDDYKSAYETLRAKSNVGMLTSDARIIGRYKLEALDGAVKLPVSLGDVDDLVGKLIQSQLHYIRSEREDTIASYGLYLDGSDFPYAYASFSKAARDYQVESLNNATGLNLKMPEVAIMTRAFAFDGAPHNSMSKLFHNAQEALKAQLPQCKVIITALNPYLGFNGGIFTGSSYFPYALSPMEYWYNEQGLYVPRSKGTMPQKLPTPPIMWLARGLDAETSRIIENLRDKEPILISETQYKKG